MDKLKQVMDETYFNETDLLASIIQKAPKPSFMRRYRSALTLALSLGLVILLVINQGVTKVTQTLGILTPTQKLAYAVVSVDINPSFELFTDLEDRVIEVHALNAEAKAMTTESWVGMDLQSVVDNLILQAIALGYLDTTDSLMDYIVVSSVSYGADGERIIKTLQTTLTQNTTLDRSVKTYVLNGEHEDYEAAEASNLSLGLYMMNGLIQNNGTPMSVTEFVANPENLHQLEEIAEHQSSVELKAIVQALIDDLKFQGIDTTNFQGQLDQSNVDLEELIEDIKDVYHQDFEDESNEEDQESMESSSTQTTSSESMESSNSSEDEHDDNSDDEKDDEDDKEED